MRIRIFYILSIFLLIMPVFALAKTGVLVSTESRTVTVGEVFLIRIEVEGSNIGTIKVAEQDVFDINTTIPVRSSSTFSTSNIFGNTIMTNKQVMEYRAVAKIAGTHQLPTFQVEVDGNLLESNLLQIEVLEPDAVPQPRTPGTPTVEDAIIIESEVEKHRVYLGEQINLTLRLLQLQRRNIAVRHINRGLPVPDTEGFYTGANRDYTSTGTRNGLDYLIREFVQPLYPTRSGELRIGPWSWRGYIQGITQYGVRDVYKELQTEPIIVEVLPLPEGPPGFSGIVGEFDINAETDTHLQQGIPGKLSVHIVGEGNPDAINAPQFPALSWAYLGSPSVQIIHPDADLINKNKKVFTYAITALEPGEHEIPPIELVYFSPKSEKYVMKESAPLVVQVRPSAEQTEFIARGGRQSQGQVEILGDDIFSIVTTSMQLRPQRTAYSQVAISFLMPPLLYVGAFVVVRQRKRLLANPALVRNKKAHSKCVNRLENLLKSTDPSLDIHLALTGYIADKINASDKGFTSQDIKELMEQHNVPLECSKPIDTILRTCERKRYSGSEISREEINALKSAAHEAINKMETHFNREGNI